MGLLEIAAADLGRGDVRGDAEHGYTGAVTIEQAVDEVQIARSAAPGADRELTRQMRLGAGREGSDLLVPDMDPFDLPLAAYRIRQTVQAVTDNSIDAVHAGGGEGFGELISNCVCHCRFSQPRAFPPRIAAQSRPSRRQAS